MNEDMQTKERYAKRTGIAGETLCHSQGAEYTKKRTVGTITNIPVAILIGLSLEFWNLPPKKKTVLPWKYS